MVNRLLKLSKSQSILLLGPRGSGKSTLIKALLKEHTRVFLIDLLRPSIEDKYRLNPDALIEEASKNKYEWVIIDEVQKLPKLLDAVHYLIENNKQKFILCGSSARKLKRGSANLLAGRAFVNYLHPLTSLEMINAGINFDLKTALSFGMLPKLLEFSSDEDKKEFLISYSLTYLKEEIQSEQIVRKLDPFRLFLEVSAQMNGKIINFSKIAREVGVDTTTVQNYFAILEDTLIGFYLHSYHSSVRKRISKSPKFYYFDTGIVRALNRTLDLPVFAGTSQFGELFEAFLIIEIRKLIDYKKKNWNLFYLKTKDDVEIDLILEIRRNEIICIEIKSTAKLKAQDIHSFVSISRDMKKSKSYCFSNDPVDKKIEHVECLHWQSGLKALGLAD